ncbi:MAG: CHAT domain-containing protein, partial [Bacteroidota bacterium]
YEYGIMLAMALHQLTDDESYLHESLQFSEKSKAILLLEAMKNSEAETYAGIPTEVISQIDDLEVSITELEKKRYLIWQNLGQQQKGLLDSLDNLIFDRKQQVTQEITRVEKEYPQYYELRYNTSTVSVAETQKTLLTSNRTIVEYFLGTTNLYIFVLNKKDFQVIIVDIDEQIYDWINIFDQTIKNFATVSSQDLSYALESYSFAAHKLYNLLIEPIKPLLREQVVIIPDEELGFLSFGAFLSAYPDNHQDIQAHHYLILDHGLSYNYSIRLLKEMSRKKKNNKTSSYLGLAPQFKPNNTTGLTSLNYNSLEVQQINQLIKGELLLSEAATKAKFLEVQSNYNVLHLATHGKANTAMGDYSFLAFSETAASTGNEALLFVKEIYNLSTNADMVILSACETNVGELQKGEGIASIARSFSYAGAKSLVTTQWSIDDKATCDLMQLFFQKLKKGQSKDLAMQNAMVEMLKSSSKAKAHPYYWASFVVVGDVESLSLKSGVPLWIWGLAAVVLLLLIYFRPKDKI